MTYRQKLKEAHQRKQERLIEERAALNRADPTETMTKHLNSMPPDIFHIETRRSGRLLTLRFGVVGASLYFNVDYWLLDSHPYISIADQNFDFDVEDFWNNPKVAEAIHDAIIWSALPIRVNWEAI